MTIILNALAAVAILAATALLVIVAALWIFVRQTSGRLPKSERHASERSLAYPPDEADQNDHASSAR